MEEQHHKISARKRVEQLYKMDHKHMLKYLGFYIDINCTLIFTEYLEGYECLEYFFTDPSEIQESEIHDISLQLAYGLRYIHSEGMIHLDLKMDNIMLDPIRWNLKIIDFGHCCIVNKKLGYADELFSGNHGNIRFMAPELTSHGRVTTKADVYSFGLLLYFFFMGTTPYEEIGLTDMAQIMFAKGSNRHFSISDSFPSHLHAIISLC